MTPRLLCMQTSSTVYLPFAWVFTDISGGLTSLRLPGILPWTKTGYFCYVDF